MQNIFFKCSECNKELGKPDMNGSFQIAITIPKFDDITGSIKHPYKTISGFTGGMCKECAQKIVGNEETRLKYVGKEAEYASIVIKKIMESKTFIKI